MYHWYLLARSAGGKADEVETGAHHIVAPPPADGRDHPSSRPADRWLLFWIGFLEALPVLVGLVIAGFLRSRLVWGTAIVLGILGSLLVTWFLHNKIPPVPMEAGTPKSRGGKA